MNSRIPFATSLKAVGGEYKVAKHTLTRLALEETRYDGLQVFLEGPRSLIFGYDDPVVVAKALVEFAAQNSKLEVDGGALEGQVLPAEQVKALASMPDVRTLQARVARQALAPASRLASTVASSAQRIAGAIEALVKKLAETALAPRAKIEGRKRRKRNGRSKWKGMVGRGQGPR